MTDEEILRLKVPFGKSILTAAEKERLIKLMLKNIQHQGRNWYMSIF